MDGNGVQLEREEGQLSCYKWERGFLIGFQLFFSKERPAHLVTTYPPFPTLCFMVCNLCL